MDDTLPIADILILPAGLVLTVDGYHGQQLVPVRFEHLTIGRDAYTVILSWPGGSGDYPVMPDRLDKHTATEADWRARDAEMVAVAEQAAAMYDAILRAYYAWAHRAVAD